jgi:AraC-like DNA-binding protein
MLHANPLSNHNLFASHDLDETRERIGHFLWPHRMRILRNDAHIETRLDGISLDNTDLFCLQYGAEVQLDPGEIGDYYLVQTTLSGTGHVTNGSRAADTGIGLTTIVSPSQATSIKMDAQCRRLILRIRRSDLERQLCQMLSRELKAPLVFELELHHSTPAGSAWLQTLEYLCQQFNLRAGCLDNPLLQQQFANMAITLLLSTQQHNYSEQLGKSRQVALPRHVCQARDYIDANLGESISLADLAVCVGVTARTLQNGFQRFLDCTPTEYMREQRLERAHRALLGADPEQAQVTDILLDLGIGNQGRFAQLYKTRFGCLPSHTLKYARA